MTNLTNLIKSAEMANVDLKKLNEVVQSGQSFEDVLKGIVEELRAKASPDATSSTDKKVSKSNYSEAKASEGKNVQEKVINESENIAQSKSSKANSNDTTVASNSDITTGKLKESIELLESTTEKIGQDDRSGKANESGEKIPTSQTGQLTINNDRAKGVDSANVKEVIRENVKKAAERQETTKNVEDVSNKAKNAANNVTAKDSPSTGSLVKQAQDNPVEKGIENGNLNDEKIKDAQGKLPKLNDEDKSSAKQIAERASKSNDSSVTKSTNTSANLNAGNEYSIGVAKSNEVIQSVKTTEPKVVEIVRKDVSTQQQDSARTLLTDTLKVLVEDSKNIVSQNSKAIREEKNINADQNNQSNQQKQVFANAGNVVKTVDNIILETNTVEGKAEKASNNRSTTQNDSSDAAKGSTYVNAATKTTTSGVKSSNTSNIKSDVVIIQNDNILNGILKEVKSSNVQNGNVQSSKDATVILNENNKSDVKPTRRTANDVAQVRISNDNEDSNGKGLNVKAVYVANAPNANDSIHAVNKYNVQNIDDEVANETNPKDGNQMLDLLSNFSKFTNERQVILLIPTLLSKVENSSDVGSNANGAMNMKGTSKKSDDLVGSSVATVISNPILRVETKIGASAQKIMETMSNDRNATRNAGMNSDNVVPSDTVQLDYLQKMLIRDAKADGTRAISNAVINETGDDKKISNSNALIMSELVKNVKIPKQESDSSRGKSTEIIDRVVDDRTKSSSYDNQKYADLYKNVRNSTDDVSKNKLEIKSIQIEYTKKKDDSNSSNSKDTLEGKPNVSNKFVERLAELSYKTNGERPEIDSTISTGQSASSDRASDLDLAERLQNSRNLEEIYEKIKQFATSYRLEEKVQMKLFPEELGNLDVELKKEGKQIQILFLAENEKAKDTIEKNSYILRERLASLDFEVRTFEVKVREEERYYDQKQGQEEGKNQNSQNGRNSRNGRSYQEAEENNKNNNRKWVIKDDDEREFGV
ncbi:MAG TPA: flagellar hook-length control protein FliK [Fervidobacterium sp.]|nr:flagellar hook-length control protein FliK [Fervidobacterium sp.]